MAAAAFWIALAAVLIGSQWHKKMQEQMRHETVRLLIEKGGGLDHEQVRELLYPKPPPAPPSPTPAQAWYAAWYPRGPRAYTQWRIAGVILVTAGPGVAASVGGIAYAAGEPDILFAALGVGALVLLLGVACFFVSRFFAPTETPRDEGTRAP